MFGPVNSSKYSSPAATLELNWDLGGAKLTGNGPEVKGGAEDWLLAPSYGWIEEPATGEVPHG